MFVVVSYDRDNLGHLYEGIIYITDTLEDAKDYCKSMDIPTAKIFKLGEFIEKFTGSPVTPMKP